MRIAGLVLGLVIAVLVAAWFKLRGPDIPYENLEVKYTSPGSHFVDLPGGFHVHYRDEGDPGLPILVLLHGFSDSFTGWRPWVRELDARFRIISVDRSEERR